jgi:gas vesicle protein
MNTKSLIGGLLAGAAVGVAIGILLAPASGKETQANLVKGTGKLIDDAKHTTESSLASLKKEFNDVVDEVVKKGKELITNGSQKA